MCVSVLEVEAVRVLETLRWTNELPEQPVIIESDSMLYKDMHCLLKLENIIEKCRVHLESRVNVSVVFVR